MKKFLKKIIVSVSTLSCTVILAQMGINNSDPKATLDIVAKTTDGSSPEGVIAPRLTGDQIRLADAKYTSTQAGVIVYATSVVTVPSTKTANITTAGYYYFDGNLWQKFTTVEHTGSTSIALNGGSFQRAALGGDVMASANSNTTKVVALQGKAVSAAVPSADDLLAYNGTTWTPLPASSLGIPKQIISVSVPGNQNIVGSIPNGVPLQFTIENYDPNNSWANNVFTVPSNMAGTYSLNMQTANSHTESTNTYPFWTLVVLEKSTDGGASWTRVMADISAAEAVDNDNGNRLFWTGNLNPGNKLRIRSIYNGNTNNIIVLGNLAITKL